jgi:hypothetical protein
LLELEASLLSSQKALLARDLAGVEQGTLEQMCLRRALEILRPWDGARTSDSEQPSSELRATAMRILHLGRVQGALLDRAQRSLRMISNLLAGPEANYGPPLCGRDLSPGHRDHGTTDGITEEPDQCPA